MRADFLRKSVQRYFRSQGFEAFFPKGGIHVGNGMIDGEVYERGIRIAVELKSDKDDILRGLGQLLEALAHGYDEALLVTSQARAERLDIKVFEASGIGLAAVNSRGELKIIVEPKIVKF
ncbi:hypothetical protein KEJ14_06960 [Candidatus Bathyarchaeota archaeon]|nr:hypothetical protein [Candidatus Bathyarchaeota archaeon]